MRGDSWSTTETKKPPKGVAFPLPRSLLALLAIFLDSPLTSELDRPVILPCEHPASVGGASHLASLHDALAEQSARGSLVQATDSPLLDYDL